MDAATLPQRDAERIMTDRDCPGCGYNLRGLPKGGRCPECGRGIGGKVSGRYADNIVHTPRSYLRTLRNGLLTMAFSVFVIWVPVVGPALWAVGVWVALTGRPFGDHSTHDAILDTRKLRTVTRWLQAAGVAGSGAVLFAILVAGAGGPNVASNLLFVLAGACLLVWAAGFVPLSAYLSAVADWAGDENAASRLRAAAWFMAVGGTLAGLCLAVPVLRFFAVWLGVAWVVTLIIFLLSVVQLANAIQWALGNQAFAEGSAARIAEKKAKRLAEPTVVHDLECRKCGQDLEGLPFGGHCPNCGLSYADSTPLPIREPPKRAPEDEAPLPLEGAGDESAPRQEIRHRRGLGDPDEFRNPAPPPASAPDAQGEIPLAPEDPPRP